MEFADAARGDPRVPAAARGGAGGHRRRPPGAALAQGRARPRRAVPRGDRRRRACPASSPPTACSRPASPSSSSRRTTTSAARGWRTPIPAAGSTSRTTTTATRSPSATTGRSTTRTQDVLHGYFRDFADEFGIRRPHPVQHRGRVGDVVGRAIATWTLRTVGPTAPRTTLDADAVISAVGQLNRPQLPDIDGPRHVRRSVVPLGRWDHDVDLTGKRVGVIGTGAAPPSSSRIVAEQAGELLIFQRTPNWFPVAALPRPGRRRAALAATATCRTTASGTASGSSGRWATACSADGRGRPGVGPKDTVGERDERRACASCSPAYLEAQYADRPDLLAKVVPQYPPAAKRILVRQRRVGRDADPRQRRAHHRPASARSRPSGVVDRRRRAARVRRAHLRHRLPGVEVPHADEGHRARRRRPPRQLGRRRPRLPRHHRAGLPQLLHALRAEHEHRRQRQHHLLLGVRGALRAGLPPHAARARRPPRPRRARRTCTTRTTQRVDAENRAMAWGVST